VEGRRGRTAPDAGCAGPCEALEVPDADLVVLAIDAAGSRSVPSSRAEEGVTETEENEGEQARLSEDGPAGDRRRRQGAWCRTGRWESCEVPQEVEEGRAERCMADVAHRVAAARPGGHRQRGRGLLAVMVGWARR
jgi:hypothetical protein